MVRKLTALAALLLSTAAVAQQQLPIYTVPYSKGPGVQGFGAAGQACLTGQVLQCNAGAPPSFVTPQSQGFGSQSANTVFAGPTSGAATSPTFRLLTAADIPSISASSITSGTLSATVFPAFTGDCTTPAGSVVTTCTKTNNVAFGTFATLTGAVTVALGGTGKTSITANAPLFGNGTSAITEGTRTGNTTVVATSTGTRTSGNCANWDANGNIIDAGAPCAAGSGGCGITTISSNTTLTTSNCTVLVNAAGGAVTVTLPAVSTSNPVITVKKVDSSSNNVVVSGTIDGGSSFTLQFQYNAITLQSNASQWWIR